MQHSTPFCVLARVTRHFTPRLPRLCGVDTDKAGYLATICLLLQLISVVELIQAEETARKEPESRAIAVTSNTDHQAVVGLAECQHEYSKR
jgi:hypothetical protein